MIAYRQVPGAAEWIINQAEINMDHTRAMEKAAADVQRMDASLHRILPFLLVLVLIVASVVLGLFANPWVGGVSFFSTLASVVIVYLKGNSPPQA
ncbi:hypothetical protein [Acidisoma cladoniae]|uniref:hypothetical protein n=1 Tax=Acidisoma cladoniae TaxID=3040935 RepID=UPI002549D401|nr:hypothetical protein [Acidisoma sp. PAMC 29798]